MKVAILMGSASDKEKMAGAGDMLARFGVPYEEHVLSAHRNPAEVSRAGLDGAESMASA